ncbi:MAG: DNA/RNA helicase domain-containing protein [Desulfuromonadales bacterium]|nr:DNA/RNA helicase domain-containing protein [Desulfuromonadales bacterium]MDW7757497.1 DNA/RNA helicase domain-containing protein [Desulfuromonadales bacterium]
MIVYAATKTRFQDDVMTNDIDSIILSAFESATGRTTGKAEVHSWKSSLEYMERVLRDDEIPYDAGVAIEYHLPQTAKRIDFILTGQDRNRQESAVLVELKQWEKAELTQSDAVVITRFKHGLAETLHPSYQAWSYKQLLEDYNETVQEEYIGLYPCAYLHNYIDDGVITNSFYEEYLKKAPVFLKQDAKKLQQFIKAHVKYGDTTRVMYRIEHGKIKPSRNLADELASMLHGNREFVLIDDQKVVFEKANRLAEQASDNAKKVLIVEGGPGTGKSVLAINLLVELTGKSLNARYVTRNSAPRQVYESKLTGHFRKTRISNMFTGSGSFYSTKSNSFDCLLVDESHRLNEKSGLFSKGENQIKEIINASRLSVFFIDEDQKVTLKDIGDKEAIRIWAKKLGAEVVEMSLESQFRCNGSNGYLAWLDNTLQIRPTANETLDTLEYDFRIIDSPSALHDLIKAKNRKNNKARMVGGYCWDWISKKNPLLKDIVIGNYKATWNLETDGQAWIIKPDSVSEVGCIHTCQGLEVDYIGVIVGLDLVVRNGKVQTRPGERSRMDKSIHGWKKLVKNDPAEGAVRLDAIIKNTYRTLMTRGQKGCYVYFVDEETRRFFAGRMQAESEAEAKTERLLMPQNVRPVSPLPFRRLGLGEARPYVNCVPLYDLKIAAGEFSEEQQSHDVEWVEVPGRPPKFGQFVAQVLGESMNRRIPNGAWCIFQMNPVGSRHGKVVLVSHREIADTDTSGHYTVKIYESTKENLDDGSWRHSSIILRPDSYLPGYEPIVLSEEQAEDLRVVGELVAVLG